MWVIQIINILLQKLRFRVLSLYFLTSLCKRKEVIAIDAYAKEVKETLKLYTILTFSWSLPMTK